MDTADPVTIAMDAHERVKRQAKDMIEESLRRRDAVIREQAKSRRQVDIVKASGLTRETIRRICGA